MDRDPLIRVEDLRTQFRRKKKDAVRAVDGVSFEIYPGETLGLVGESGSGKSVTALSLLGLVESPPGEVVGGCVMFQGENLVAVPERRMQEIRGRHISMIFQEPMTSLHPIFSVGDQIIEVLRVHLKLSKKEARKRGIEMLRQVEIPDPVERFDQYPHQLSGGMRQRVMIAMALACDPNLLIADEPTTALDVTVQARILELMNTLKARSGAAILMITHDLGVIAETCDRVAVMYAGRIVEYGPVEQIFEQPRHPYTVGLLRSIPPMDRDLKRLDAIPGIVPGPDNLPIGCKFNTRCLLASEKCLADEPDLELVDGHRQSRCWHWDKVEAPEALHSE